MAQVIDHIIKFREAVLEEQRSDPTVAEKYTTYHCMHYLLDEKDDRNHGTTTVFEILDKKEKIDSREIKTNKILNLYSAVTTYFPPDAQLKIAKPISIEFVKELHSVIGASGVIDKAGEFRNSNAAPRERPDHLFLEPQQIQAELQKLIEECNERFLSSDLQLMDAVKYGACFFERFLYIHPFGDGNGRVARLLLSLMLSPFTVGPMNWFLTSKNRRSIYIKCLEKREDDTGSHSALARFILQAIHQNYETICNALNLYQRVLGRGTIP